MRTYLTSVYVLGALILTLGLGQAITEETDVGGPTWRSSIPQQSMQVATTTYNVELLSLIGGAPFGDVEVQGNYAYVSKGSWLIVLDISDPADPVRIGELRMPHNPIRNIYAIGQYLYVDSWIVDVTDPSEPYEVDRFLGPIGPVVGNYMYAGWRRCKEPPSDFCVAGFTGGLEIRDVSDPVDPVVVGELKYENHGLDLVYVAGNHAYAIDHANNLRVIDVSDPARPMEVGYLEMPDSLNVVNDLLVAGSYAYVTAGARGIYIIDVSDPTTPEAVTTYDMTNARHIYIIGPYAYVSDPRQEDEAWVTGNIRILDVSDPNVPREVGSYSVSEWPGTFVVEGNRLYALSDDTLRVLDSSDPPFPVELGTYFNPAWYPSWGMSGDQPTRLHADGQHAYVLTSYTDYRPYPQDAPVQVVKLRIYDISNPRMPMKLGSYDLPSSYVRDFYVSDDYAFVIQDDSRLQIIDVSDLADPKEVGAIQVPALNIHVAGQYAYVTGDGAMRIIDVSDPAAPVVVGSYFTAGWVGDVYAAANYAYLTDTLEGYTGPDGKHAAFRVIDVSDPSEPVAVGAFGLPAYPEKVYVSGNYAYVLAGRRLDQEEARGIWVADVSNPISPTVVGFYESRDARDLFVADKFAFLVEWSGLSTDSHRLLVLDISVPTRPIAVGAFDIPSPGDISVTDNCIYLAAKELVTFHLVPSAPGTAGFTALGGIPHTSFLPLIMKNDPGPGICG
jgi:hypothetical protein